MTWTLIGAATAASAALLLGAFGFQYLGGMAPCELCLWQRWPHGIALLIGSIALAFKARGLALLGAFAALTTAGIGFYHTGVERGWWQGLSSCSSGDISNLSTDALMDQILAAPLVRCDEVAWSFATLSMASWNVIISLVAAALWVSAFAGKART